MKTFGFPRMLFEESEKRDFMPNFFKDISEFNIVVKLEIGYGAKLGYKQEDYLYQNPDIKFASRSEVFQCDVVTIIRTPPDWELIQMKGGSTLFSMIHFATHKNRCELLKKAGVKMFAMDSVVDDFDKRMIEYMKGTAENGITTAVHHYLKNKPHAKEIKFLVIGAGRVGKAVVNKSVHSSKSMCICIVIGRSTTTNLAKVAKLLTETNILVDATYREDPSKIVIPNKLIGLLPKTSVILDLAADQYDENAVPLQVKAIEGIPTGNLDKYVFMPDDSAFDRIPEGINSTNRRITISCYSWPAVDAKKCLEVYQRQLVPFMGILADDFGTELLSGRDNFYERALLRSNYEYFNKI